MSLPRSARKEVAVSMTVSGDFHGVSNLWPSKTLQKVQSLLNAIGDEELVSRENYMRLGVTGSPWMPVTWLNPGLG